MLANNSANIKAVITADDKASHVIKGFGDTVDNAGHKVGNMLKATALAGVAAAGAAVAFGVSSVKSYQESEDALAQLNATLTSTGGKAGVTADMAIELANSLQKVTKFSDEQVLSAENLMLTFTSISKDVFPDAINAALDMSTALKEDLQSSVIRIGKALQDPVLGMTALRKAGVNVNEEFKNMITTMVESGDTMGAQKAILAELATEFGGSALAAAQTFSGRMQILKNQFDEVKERIGLAIVEGITPLAARLGEFVASDQFQAWLDKVINWLSVNLPIAIDYVVNTLIPNLKNIFDSLWPIIQTVVGWLGNFIQFLADNEPALWTFIGVLGVMKAAFFINDAVIAFQGAMAAIRGAHVMTAAVLSAPILITIAIGAALAALELIRRKAIETWNEIDRTERAFANMKSAQQDARARLEQLVRTGTPEQQRVAAEQLRKGTAAGSFATGTSFASGGIATVGEQGPEQVILPRGSQVIPNNSVRGGGGTVINVTVQAGAFMGSKQDARRYAKVVVDAIKDVATMNGTTPMELMA